MEPPSFTIEFLEHLPPERRQYCLAQLGDTGAAVEQIGDRVYCVVCSKPKQLAHVGWALFHTHFSSLCRVIATSGEAEDRASTYLKPPPNC
jgi:hypothetical protein